MRPLFDKLINHISKSKARFHMPGHNGNNLFGLDNRIDLTELSGLDNLLSSSSCIYESEKLLAKDYNSKFSLMLTQGSTSAMQISLYYCISEDYTIVAIGQMHSSFYNSIKLFNGKMMLYDSIDDFNKNRDLFKEKCAIYVTSPNYFGQVMDIDKIKKNIGDLIVVDSAHGAHFAFSKLLPVSLTGKADISFVSFHKTMPASTGAAALFANDEQIYLSLKYYRAMIHSTSPNYMTLTSIDCARYEFEKNGEKYFGQIKQIIDSYNGQISDFEILKTDDFSRLVLQKKNIDAYDVLEQLHAEGIDIEMAYLDKLVLILTPYNISNLDKIDKALKGITKKELEIKDFNIKAQKINNTKPSKIEFVDLEEAIGRVAACEIGIYPPSIPVVNTNEIITKESIKVLKANDTHLFGLVNNKVAVLK